MVFVMANESIQHIIADLRLSIQKITGCEHPFPDTTFHKHDKYVAYGLRTADFYTLMDSFRPRFLELTLQQRLSLSRQLLATHIGELGHTGIRVLSLSIGELIASPLSCARSSHG